MGHRNIIIKNNSPKNSFSNRAFSLIELSIVLIVISILIIGAIKSSTLINQAKLSAAKQLTIDSPILKIDGLFLWYETSLSQSFLDEEIGDNGLISTWRDISKSNPDFVNNMIQNTSSRQPKYKPNAINGLPALYFDGSDDRMNAENNIFIGDLTPQSQITIFMVIKLIDGGVFLKIENSGSNRIGIEESNSSISFDFPNDNTAKLTASNNIIEKNTILTLDKNSTTQSIFINGSLDTSQSNALTLSSFSDVLFIGANKNGGYESKIYIAELIIYNHSLSTQKREDVERYLGQKYDISI